METNIAKLEKTGIGYINMMAGTILGHVVVFYLFAWRFDILESWLYYVVVVLLNALNIILLYRYNMPLLNERGKARSDIARAEKLIIPLMLVFTYFIPPMAAGLEYRLAGTLHPNAIMTVIGLALLLASSALENWAMLVNRHFEKNIRIQSDRDQAVVTGGPYRFVRHPGYLGFILRLAAFPLILGSLYSIPPVVIGIAVHIIRTGIEDNLLKKELTGYAEYSKKTRYRLIPMIW